MPQAGLYMTQTDGLAWTRATANGLKAKVNSLAVHPHDANVVAVGAADGLYLSHDAGNHFEPLIRSTQVLALWFELDGEHLWVSSYANAPELSRMGLKNDERSDEHTSELQSLMRNSYAVSCLKKTTTNHKHTPLEH